MVQQQRFDGGGRRCFMYGFKKPLKFQRKKADLSGLFGLHLESREIESAVVVYIW